MTTRDSGLIVDDDADTVMSRIVPDDADTESQHTVEQTRVVPDDATTENESVHTNPSGGAVARMADTGTNSIDRSDRERREVVAAKPSAGPDQAAAGATPASADGPGPFPGARKARGNDVFSANFI